MSVEVGQIANPAFMGVQSSMLSDPEALAARAQSGDKQAINDVAKGFESLFMSQLIKQMRQTLEPGALFAGDQADIHGGLFDLYLGRHMAQAGGLGIGAMVKHQLEARFKEPGESKGHAEKTTG